MCKAGPCPGSKAKQTAIKFIQLNLLFPLQGGQDSLEAENVDDWVPWNIPAVHFGKMGSYHRGSGHPAQGLP